MKSEGSLEAIGRWWPRIISHMTIIDQRPGWRINGWMFTSHRIKQHKYKKTRSHHMWSLRDRCAIESLLNMGKLATRLSPICESHIMWIWEREREREREIDRWRTMFNTLMMLHLPTFGLPLKHEDASFLNGSHYFFSKLSFETVSQPQKNIESFELCVCVTQIERSLAPLLSISIDWCWWNPRLDSRSTHTHTHTKRTRSTIQDRTYWKEK